MRKKKKINSVITLCLFFSLLLFFNFFHSSSLHANNRAIINLPTISNINSFEWNTTWGSSGDDRGNGIVLDDSGNIYITGNNYADGLLLKYNSSGSLLWNKRGGDSSSDVGNGIALDASGNVFITGYTWSYGESYNAAFLLKYDSAGKFQWNKIWGLYPEEKGFGIALDGLGNIFITGYTRSSEVAASRDVSLSKYDSSGNLQWYTTWGGSDKDEGRGIAVDGSGNIFITGYTWSHGTDIYTLKYNFFLLKYNSSGNLLWDITWDGSDDDYGQGIAVDTWGYVYITGSTQSYREDNYDIFLLKYDSSGNLLLDKTWGGSRNDHGNGIALDSSGNAFITGYTYSYGAGYTDLVLLKYELDTDNDGLSDNSEVNTYFTDSNNSDTDGDGLSDGWEVYYGLNPTWSSDASFDGDSDGLTNHEEYQYDTDPTNFDTDGDGLSDGDEVINYHTDPTNSDTDGDRYSDGQEIQMGTDPLSSLSNLSITLTIIIVIVLSVGVASLVLISKYRKKVRKKKEIEFENRFPMIDYMSRDKRSWFGIKLTQRQSINLFFLALVGTMILAFLAFEHYFYSFLIMIPGFDYYVRDYNYDSDYYISKFLIMSLYYIFILILLIISIYSLIRSSRIAKSYSESKPTKNSESWFGIILTQRQSTELFKFALVGTFVLSIIAYYTILFPLSNADINSTIPMLNALLPYWFFIIISLIICIYSLIKSRGIAKIVRLVKPISENKAHPVIPPTPKIPDYTIQTKILKDEKRVYELNDSLFVYCPYCGTKMPKTLNIKFCIVCGKNIENDLNF